MSEMVRNLKPGVISFYIVIAQVIGYPLYTIFHFTVAGGSSASGSLNAAFICIALMLAPVAGIVLAVKSLRAKEAKAQATLGLVINGLIMAALLLITLLYVAEFFAHSGDAYRRNPFN